MDFSVKFERWFCRHMAILVHKGVSKIVKTVIVAKWLFGILFGSDVFIRKIQKKNLRLFLRDWM